MIARAKRYRSLPRPKRLKHQFDLLRVLVRRGLTVQYKRSIFGIAWSLLNPLMMLFVFYFLFKMVLSLDIPRYSAFAFTGLLAWNWFQSSLFQSPGAITDNRELIRQPGFPTAVLPAVTVTTNLVHYLLALPVLGLLLLTGDARLGASLVLLPVVMAVQFVLTLSLSYLIATINVTFRDMQHLLGVVLTLFFYVTPVFYDASQVPERYRIIYQLNPMAHLVTAYRSIFLEGAVPNLTALGILTGVSMLLLAIGYQVFNWANDRFVEEL